MSATTGEMRSGCWMQLSLFRYIESKEEYYCLYIALWFVLFVRKRSTADIDSRGPCHLDLPSVRGSCSQPHRMAGRPSSY